MRITDYIEQSFSNLLKKKLRTFLTTFGVVIGIGALVSMFSFGKGVQKNITDKFKELELFNYVSVFPGTEEGENEESSTDGQTKPNEIEEARVLDDQFVEEIRKMKGVESAFAEIRFPAVIRFNGQEKFSLIQVLSADICRSGLMKLRAGQTYASDEDDALIISDFLLRLMEIKKPATVIGQEIEVRTLHFDLSLLNLANIASMMRGNMLPLSQQSYTFTIVGVAEHMGFGGSLPLRSAVYIPPGASQRMEKLPLTDIWDFFRSSGRVKGYSAVTISVSSPKYIEPLKARMEDWGLETFALIDQMEELRIVFMLMDTVLAAVGMIGIAVAFLGIINTMVMSIMERYKEIGIMKAVGASDRDVKKIFFFESGVIGFLGGVFGLVLGWVVSMVINQVVNYFLAKQGVPYIDYFNFPWWLCLGAIVFSILVSLAAGFYPTLRAARVDPVIALRHD